MKQYAINSFGSVILLLMLTSSVFAGIGNPYVLWAFSFQPEQEYVSGASVWIATANNSPVSLRYNLWDGLPRSGSSSMLATTSFTSGTGWAAGSWDPVSVTTGKEYFVELQLGTGLYQVTSLNSYSTLYDAANLYATTWYLTDPSQASYSKWWHAMGTPNNYEFVINQISYSSTPEPATLLLLGLGGLVLRIRKK